MKLAFGLLLSLATFIVSAIADRKYLSVAGKFGPFCPYGRNGSFCTEDNYYKFMPPKANESGGTIVKVSFGVLGLSGIDSFEKDFTLVVHVTLAWEDQRIIWNEPPVDQELILDMETLK